MDYIFLAGANGSGKSTLIKNLLSLDEYQGFLYICADEFEKNLTDISDEKERMKKARDAAINYRNMLSNERKDIIYESVASHPSHIQDLQDIKNIGYKITTLYVATEDPDINIERIQLRGRDNDSYLTPERVIRRYEKSLENLSDYIEKSDTVIAYDNSINYVAVFTKTAEGECYLIKSVEWAKKYIVEKLEKKGIHILTENDIEKEKYEELLKDAEFLIEKHTRNSYVENEEKECIDNTNDYVMNTTMGQCAAKINEEIKNEKIKNKNSNSNKTGFSK